MNKKLWILIFDLPSKKKSLARSVQRKLNKSGAKTVQKSVWESVDLDGLLQLASLIKKSGGSAMILEENPVFK